MTDDLLQVHTDTLRRCAGSLTDVSYRLGRGLGADPILTGPQAPSVTSPGPATGPTESAGPGTAWAASEALAGLESAVHGWLCALGGRTAQTSADLHASADGYEAADERAARRLSGTWPAR